MMMMMMTSTQTPRKTLRLQQRRPALLLKPMRSTNSSSTPDSGASMKNDDGSTRRRALGLQIAKAWEQRLAGIVAIDAAIKQAIQKDAELRRSLLSTLAGMANDDLAFVGSELKIKKDRVAAPQQQQCDKASSTEATAPISTASAYYEPWNNGTAQESSTEPPKQQ
jgi:hypothetical protein